MTQPIVAKLENRWLNSTPLTGIKWFSELLLKERAGKITQKQKDFLTQIYNSNHRMIRLVSDLLDVSHIDTGAKFETHKTKSDIQEMINQAIQDSVALIEEKDIIIKDRVKTVKRMEFEFDKQKIRQVFYNLISNAIKYSKQGGIVEISCDCDWKNKKMINFHVKDEGIGIPKSQQNKVFSKFFRADNAIITQADGTGLGLYITKAIIEAHGGKLWFESEENKGTTFHFSLKN
ncbi:hypothetical protein A2331_04180 [Candidatus Falkowbacteria bacterium RIFOXYB2_FULL_34_18]|uniref:histidine kinase n=1 Tax=Candidatus Falkowbacteria bacterium RIFOXYD2_FULL_34_120 TaxID=1798007 RepID=A0A1F5TNE0_9BACT|nr:MAG: hypothetical protein A2500_00075 [Candidatus Falkowbacteria bacterium RIFOXYC12_FULL_34_55]OGF28825.1 MAG: hypothetical protein A2331_04180 [Candidatus Falkowbacteria bacterium RIFOXYB2_FULL_34_18]OGF40367.1 MAG: hypothetical protein A2531_00095 [Candidatus Falkowbacteria bacterium RIFOXYD2_FULL_34_120]